MVIQADLRCFWIILCCIQNLVSDKLHILQYLAMLIGMIIAINHRAFSVDLLLVVRRKPA